LPSAGHGAVALGITRRALGEIATVAAKKPKRVGMDGLGSQQLCLHEFGKHDAQIQAYRAFLFDAYAWATSIVPEGEIAKTDKSSAAKAVESGADRVPENRCLNYFTWRASYFVRNGTGWGRLLSEGTTTVLSGLKWAVPR
jgi:indole-3-acetate monooxygenase